MAKTIVPKTYSMKRYMTSQDDQDAEKRSAEKDEKSNRYISASKMFDENTNTPTSKEKERRKSNAEEDKQDIPLKPGLRYKRNKLSLDRNYDPNIPQKYNPNN